MALLDKNDIKIYYTTADPNVAQLIPSLSIGGFPSTNEISTYTYLSTVNIGLYDKEIIVDDVSVLEDYEYIGIDREVMKVEGIDASNNSLTISERGVNSVIGCYSKDESVKVYGIDKEGLFNNNFSSGNQYRCLAIVNESSDGIATDLSVSISIPSTNPTTTFSIAVENTKHQEVQGVSDSWTNLTLTDSDLDNNPSTTGYESNIFSDSALVMDIDPSNNPNSGQVRVIRSFDEDNGKMVFETPFDSDYIDPSSDIEEVAYTILPSPSQRVASGLVERQPGQLMGSFEVDAEISVMSSFEPTNVFYLWISRNITIPIGGYENNAFVIDFKYKD